MVTTIPANKQPAHSFTVLDGPKGNGKAASGNSAGQNHVLNGINGHASHGTVFLNGRSNSRLSGQNAVMLNGKNHHAINTTTGGLPIALPADPETTKRLLSNMKESAASFSVSGDSSVPHDALFNPTQNNVSDGLHSQTVQVALLGGGMGTAQDINDFHQQMREQDQRQKDGIDEIQSILDDMLEHQVIASMREQVEKEIVEQIDELVKEHIAECLKVHIPQDLQDDVADSKRELHEVRLALHNSESRRLNANLRTANPDEVLNTIYMANGLVSPHFPKNLKSLFSLDADRTRILMEEYKLPDPSDSRDRNLNRLMQFLGVRYQLIRPDAASSSANA